LLPMPPASHFRVCSRSPQSDNYDIERSGLILESPADYLRDVASVTYPLGLILDVFKFPYGNSSSEDGSAPVSGRDPVQFS
jgi:hypothetical protein